MHIAVAGMGYVGLAAAVLLARHNQVVAVDPLEWKVERINSRRSPLQDPLITEQLADPTLQLTATVDCREPYAQADCVIIATPTNYHTETHSFDTSSVERVIGEVLAVNPTALIVIKSTVPVGYTASLGSRFPGANILFSPEFLREGQALHDNFYPSRIIVGYPKDREDLRGAAESFGRLLLQGARKKAVPVLLMYAAEAEAVKLFSNTYLALRVAFFNELDTYAELQGMDTRQIIEGVGCDPRIGDYYNNPSFGYGGYCLPKDTKQLLANYEDIPNNIIGAVVEANRTRKDFVTERILERADGGVIGIYRLTMKQGADNFRKSSVLGVMRRLREQGARVVIFEPLLEADAYEGSPVIRDREAFCRMCSVIVANRYSPELDSVREKVYTRDLYFRD